MKANVNFKKLWKISNQLINEQSSLSNCIRGFVHRISSDNEAWIPENPNKWGLRGVEKKKLQKKEPSDINTLYIREESIHELAQDRECN